MPDVNTKVELGPSLKCPLAATDVVVDDDNDLVFYIPFNII